MADDDEYDAPVPRMARCENCGVCVEMSDWQVQGDACCSGACSAELVERWRDDRVRR